MSDESHRRKRRRRESDDEGDPREAAVARRMDDGLRDQIESWALEAADAHGLRLFDIEPTRRGRWIVRVYVEQIGKSDEDEEGVTVDECAEVSRYMEAYMDADHRIPENYVLEVSSPGLERPINTLKHAERSVGERVQMVVREQIDGKNKVVGHLEGVEDDVLTLELEESGESAQIAWEDVAEARLKQKFDQL